MTWIEKKCETPKLVLFELNCVQHHHYFLK